MEVLEWSTCRFTATSRYLAFRDRLIVISVVPVSPGVQVTDSASVRWKKASLIAFLRNDIPTLFEESDREREGSTKSADHGELIITCSR